MANTRQPHQWQEHPRVPIRGVRRTNQLKERQQRVEKRRRLTPSRVRCYVDRCNGRCSLGGDAGSNAAGLHGDTLTLLRSSACTSVITHAPAESSQIFLQSGPVRHSSALRLLRLMLRLESERMVAKRGLRLDPLFLLDAEPALLAAPSSPTLSLCAPDKAFYTNALEALLTTFSLETIDLEVRTHFSQLHFKSIQTL